VFPLRLDDHTVIADLLGPPSFEKDGTNATIEFKLVRDPRHNVARIQVQGQEIILKQGEWSEWIPLRFELLPHLAHMSAMAQFYMQEVHPQLRLYVSPINIDPLDPALPICTPDGYSRELATAIGRFCTKGFPEETKALSHGIFSNREYVQQANLVLSERRRAFDYELDRFREGLLFFYFSSIDQNTHMMWRTMDPDHHLFEPDECTPVKEAVRDCYRAMDEVLAQTLAKVDARTTLMIVSDHGFAPFTREFNLSSWLVENGYAALKDSTRRGDDEYFSNVDWSRTRAYALGLNGLYINVRNRDRHGTVEPRAKRELAAEIAARLEAYRDPLTGERVVLRAYPAHEIYRGEYARNAADLMIGYNRGYRISDEAVLGTFPAELLKYRQDKWAADHCMDPSVVPGVFLTNRKVAREHPGLADMAPTILSDFGLAVPREMDGTDVFGRGRV
jgi:predicted AlkP superfamily phosphohydrolase/phosphomutase